jgi:hypothetical protein
MADWLEMREQSLEDLRSNFQGVYTAYRHSLLKPGFVLVGRLEIWQDPTSNAIKTKENYFVEESPITSATSFELHGYIFRRNNRYRILSKHVRLEEMQHIFINSCTPRGGVDRPRDVIRMSGVVSDVQGNVFYSTRICFVRQPPAELRSIPRRKVPPEILVEIGSAPTILKNSRIVTF